MSTPHLEKCPKINCNQKNDCCPFRKIDIPAVLGDDSEGSDVAPENGAYRNALVEYKANGNLYMYSSDGIWTKLSMVAGGHGAATVDYVDAEDARTLANAKAYADSIIPTADVTKTYVDTKDAEVLAEAKAYSDAHSGDSITFVDLTITGYDSGGGRYTLTASASMSIADIVSAWNAGADIRYRLNLSSSPIQEILPGVYEIAPLYAGQIVMGSYSDPLEDLNMQMVHIVENNAEVVRLTVYGTASALGLAPVATSGDYDDLNNKPAQPTKTSDLINDGATGTSTYVEASGLANVATSGSYNDLINQPDIPEVILSNVDIGEGEPLEANMFYGVYIDNGGE